MFNAIKNRVAQNLYVPKILTTQLHDEKNEELLALIERSAVLNAKIPEITDKLKKTSMSTPSRFYSDTGNTGYYSSQGGCTDGEYIYYYLRPQTTTNAGKIVKAKLNFNSSGEVTSATEDISSGALYLDKGNDMTFHAPSGNLYIASQIESSAGCRLDVVRASDLVKQPSIYLPFYFSNLAYDSVKDLFVFSSGDAKKYICQLKNDEFVIVKTLESTSDYTSYTSQGLACDGAFIYHLWYGTVNKIEIFDWLGNQHGAMSFSLAYEPEWIDKIGKYNWLLGVHPIAYGIYAYKFIQN